MFKNVAAKLTVYVFDSLTNLPKVGDAANLTAYRSIDDGAVTVLTDTSATEQDATNAKGFYIFDLTAGETNGDKVMYSCKSSTANMVCLAMPAVVYTTPNRFPTLVIDAAGLADANMVKAGPTGAGTAQTAGDIPARLPAALTSGKMESNIGSVTAGVIAAASFAANALDAVWSVATRLLTAGTNIVLVKGTGVTGFNDLSAAQVNAEADIALTDYDGPTHTEMTSELATADDAVLAAIAGLNNLSLANIRTAVGLATANLDTQLADLPTNAELTSALAAADDAVLAAIAALNNLSQANIRTALGMGSANLDTQLGDLPTNAELATALAGADDAILAAVSALSVIITAIDAKTTNLPSDPADQSLVIAATNSLASAITALNNLSSAQVTTAVLDAVIEGAVTLKQSIRLANAANAGKSNGMGTGTIHIRDLADTKNRVTGVADDDGNRTSSTLDLT